MLSSHAIIIPTTRNKSYKVRNLYTNSLKEARAEYLTVQTNLTDINNKLLKIYNDKDPRLMIVVASFPNIVRKMDALKSIHKWQLYSKLDMAHSASIKMINIKSQIINKRKDTITNCDCKAIHDALIDVKSKLQSM